MQMAQPGQARREINQYWSIVNLQGNVVARFDSTLFNFIPHGAHVYYIDLNLDKLCENVQVRSNVEDRVDMAKPTNGFTREAREVLVDYIMDALKAALFLNSSTDQQKYLDNLDAKMQLVKSEAMADPSKKVGVPLLKRVLQKKTG